MAGKIICWFISFVCGAVFYSIGAHAKKREKPMWFWSGTEVDASQISDVKQYNRENAVMWKLYGLWFFAAGLVGAWNSEAFMVMLILSCTVGLALLVWAYKRIFNKYRAQ